MITTPNNRSTLWVISNVLWLAAVPALLSVLMREQAAGLYLPEADSISIPLFGAAIMAVVALPFLNAGWWWLTRGYPGAVPVFARARRGACASVVSITLVLLAAALVAIGVLALVENSFEFAVIAGSWVYLALAYRAAYCSASSQRARHADAQAQSTLRHSTTKT